MKKGKPKGTQWQRVLRTCLSFALIIALALGNVVPINVAKAEGSSGASNPFNVVTEFMNVDFSKTDWSEKSGISAVSDETKKIEVVSEKGNESNKCLMVKQLDAANVGPSVCLKYNGETTGKHIVYEYKLSFDGETKSSERARIVRYDGGGDVWSNHLDQKKGTIASKVDTSVTTKIEHGKWVCVSVVADYTTSTCDVYVDGVCYIQDGAFGGNAVAINLYNSKQDSHILIDDMRIYEV